MNISEEISKLADLRDQGVLSTEEFEQAKKKVLSSNQPPSHGPPHPSTQKYQFEDKSHESFGKAANRYVTFQIIMAVIGVIIFLIFVAPIMCSSGSPFNRQPSFGPAFPR